MTKRYLPLLTALAILAGCSSHDKPSAPAAAAAPAPASTAPVAVIVDVPAKPAQLAPAKPRVVAPKPVVNKQGPAAPELSEAELNKLRAKLDASGR